ncbi:hypothetical protein EOD41_18115 [Mucilaginibacter limnophilus]|uniref:Uncharacterized protein n=1 Tax=Mucilaginibacter limnophilus TaxID=1932778 RepID=A0A437ML06_9SPHI|nr:hypothetical protein [Mucilaginibacter limnophilus]RVT98286.1 hypothetical protein EOD41_18115 [Mucilaginibacter limnophilus]
MEKEECVRKFKRKGIKLVLIPLAIAACLALASLAVMLLWNNVLVACVSGITAVTFWQAMGIFILCKILFGFGKGGGAPWMRYKDRERFKHMTPEERIRFRDEMESRMCGWKKRRDRNFGEGNFARPSAADETAD